MKPQPREIAANLRQRLDTSLTAGPPPSWPPPRVPDHELVRSIGRGNYGEVWLARNVTGQWRAVKVVRRRHFSHERPYDREFHGIAHFEPISRSHAGVVPVLHVGRDDAAGFFYYVMELADAVGGTSNQYSVISGQKSGPTARGGYPAAEPSSRTDPLNTDSLNTDYCPRTLRSDLKRRTRLPVGDVLRLGVDLAGALGHLHQHGLVHRDVKPSNVIYIGGRPRLADIGLVAGIDEARSFVGTEGFIAPEGPGTPQADLFALGKLLYEAVTGRDRCDFPSLPEDLSEWPEHEAVLELNEVLVRACAPNTKLRHRNAAELAGDLNLLIAGRSIRRTYSLERRLHVIYQAALAAALVALLAIGGMWFQRARRAEAELRVADELALRQRAERAEAEKGAALRQALLEQARALGQSLAPDRRSAALAVLRQAAAIAPGADLRTVAAAALATPEMREAHTWAMPESDPFGPSCDPTSQTYVHGDGRGLLTFHRVSDDALVRTLSNGTTRVENIAFSRDGHWLVTVDKGVFLRLWDLAAGTNRLLARSSSWCLDFSPDSRFLYRFRNRGNFVREELATGGQTEFPLRLNPTYAMAVHPHLPLAMVSHANGEMPSVMHLENGERIDRLVNPSPVMSLAWQPSGRQLVAGCDNGSIWVWDWPVKTTPRHILRHHKRRVNHLSVHPGGRWLSSASWDGESCLWDLENGQLAAVLPGRAMTFSADGTRLPVARPGLGVLMSFDESFQPRQWPAHHSGAAPVELAFSPDGQWLATGGDDGAWLWDPASWKPIVRLASEFCGAVGFAADRSQVILAGARRWQAWELPSIDVVKSLQFGIPVPDPPGPLQTEATVQSGIPGTKLLQLQELRRVEHPWAKVETLLWAGAVEPRSARWVSFEEPPRRERGTVLRIGIVGQDAVKELFFETKSGGNASISPDGRWAARGNWLDRDVWVIDLDAQEAPHCIPQPGNTATAFSQDSSEVVVCAEHGYRIITLSDWRERLFVPRDAPDSRPGRVAYSHGRAGRHWIALLASRSRIRLVLPDGREYLTLTTHEGRHLDGIEFSPDDRFLVAASPDHHLVVWDLAALRERLAELGMRDEDANK